MPTIGEIRRDEIIASSLHRIAEEMRRANDLKMLEIQVATVGVRDLGTKLQRIMGNRYIDDWEKVEGGQ